MGMKNLDVARLFSLGLPATSLDDPNDMAANCRALVTLRS